MLGGRGDGSQRKGKGQQILRENLGYTQDDPNRSMSANAWLRQVIKSVDINVRVARDPVLYSRDDWKHDLRGMPVIVVNRVHSGSRPTVVVERLPRVWINIETREIAAGKIHSDSVAFLENHCCRVHLDRYRIDLPRLHELCMFE